MQSCSRKIMAWVCYHVFHLRSNVPKVIRKESSSLKSFSLSKSLDSLKCHQVMLEFIVNS
ncbi:hypothetical protein OUZ56_015994 [Daphnia magna]|uniref:Uncharacterized protein n=1 Tax=Daphnia magna TaxID=35525 RepID=A0ABR0APD2_9CRUS|nr:hypothetical protein OUZ56_015994 [Daphnia magna]